MVEFKDAQTKEEKINVTFTLDWDGSELTVYLGSTDVTQDIKREIGKDAFSELRDNFIKAGNSDADYDKSVDDKLCEVSQ